MEIAAYSRPFLFSSLLQTGVWFVQFDSLRIVSASADGTVKIWDLQSGMCECAYAVSREHAVCGPECFCTGVENSFQAHVLSLVLSALLRNLYCPLEVSIPNAYKIPQSLNTLHGRVLAYPSSPPLLSPARLAPPSLPCTSDGYVLRLCRKMHAHTEEPQGSGQRPAVQ